MIKILSARYCENFCIALQFSDGTEGKFDASAYLKERHGSLLEALHDEVFFKRFFIDAGALCWPNGLELSPQRLHALCVLEAA
ncbi:MAG: DUF2442 domain-containing protein [Betaproteobacteria bacterium]|nr:DUF2442 domain-containing protein [Betaproteobacteria bacterium]